MRDAKTAAQSTNPTIVAIDVDGTIVDSEGGVASGVLLALRRVAVTSHLIIATARPVRGVASLLRDVGHPCSVVALNGAVIRSVRAQSTQSLNVMPSDVQSAVLCSSLVSKPDAIFLFGSEEWFAWGSPELIAYEASIIGVTETRIGGDIRNSMSDVCKITVVQNDPEKMEATRRSLRDLSLIHAVLSKDHYLEITMAGVSKATGVLAILGDGWVGPLVAIGDGMNDIPLFSLSDVSYAMPHARPEVKASATTILPEPAQASLAAVLSACANGKTIVKFP